MWGTSDIEVALLRGTETRELEFKTACSPANTFEMGRVVRGVLALSNIGYGGRVVVGVDDKAVTAMTPGLSEEQLAKWADGASAHDFIAKYADPPIDVVITDHQLSNGNTVVLLEVPGIAGEAHFCTKDLHDATGQKLVLRRHALYTRSSGKPESVEVSTRAQMAEIIDSSAQYRLRTFVEQANRAGVTLLTDAGPANVAVADADFFDRAHREAFG